MASKFYYGLNTSNYLNDIEDTRVSLSNIGIDIDDVNIIRGINESGVSSNDIKTISGLEVDVKKELISLDFATNRYIQILEEFPTAKDQQPSNLNANSRLAAKAIKYKYIDFENVEIKSSDISTSRVSSWSSFDNPPTSTSPIFYGGDLEIIPDTVTSQSKLRVTGLNTTHTPSPIRYSAEVATHLVEMEINGTVQKFYAMRGIPLSFTGFFKSASFSINVNPDGVISPSWRVQNTENNIEYEYENVSSTFTLQFQDIASRERNIEFYYVPSRITKILMPSMNISEFPLTTMDSLIQIDFSNNDLREMPNFDSIAPSLRVLNILGNNLTRTDLTLSEQISRIPNTLETLNIGGCFDYNELLDLSSLTSLKSVTMNSYYYGGSQRFMEYVGETPVVNSSTIEEYRIQNQRFRKLEVSIAEATNLKVLDIHLNNITELSEEYLGSTELRVSSTNMTYFRSSGNSHNIIDMSNQNNLTYYEHTYSRNLTGDKSFVGKIANCPSLEKITIYATDAEGDIAQVFSGLDSLATADLRWTRLSGSLENATFATAQNLQNLYIAGSLYSGDFFESQTFYNTPNLKNMYVYSNRNITGSLPDFSRNTDLFRIYITNTSLSGIIPNFDENILLRYLYLMNSEFSGNVPDISLQNILVIDISRNNLQSDSINIFPELLCANLRRLYVYSNNLSGPITSMSGCPRIQILNYSNNSFDFYNSGSFVENTELRDLNIANNNLTTSSIKSIIDDLYENWNLRNRANVRVNLLGNNYNLADINSDETVNQKIEFLRNTQNWSILL